MKKAVSFLLIVAFIFGMTACDLNGEGKKGKAGLSVGYAALDISPNNSLPLDGYAGTQWAPEHRWSQSVDWPLKAITIAITDAKDNTVIIVALDMLTAFMADAMREVIAAETGVEEENIFFHCTHNHSGVALRHKDPKVTTYITELTYSVRSAAKVAMEDRKPVTELATTFARAEGCNTVRHYLVTDGEYLSSNKAKLAEDVTWYGHTTVADDMIQLVRFTREGGKPVVMMNYQGHLCAANIAMTAATSDYAGVMRSYVEKELNCLSIFIQGGGGNLAMGTYLEDEQMRASSKDYQHLGNTLGADVVAAAADFVSIPIENIQHKEQMTLVDTKDGGKLKAYLNAFSIGDFAMVSAPFEIFDTNAMYVRENSPFKMTFYASCTNGANQYLATPECFDWVTSYEVSGSPGAKGAAETVQNAQLEMLGELFGAERTPTEKPEGYVRGEFVPVTDGHTYTVLTREDGSVMKSVRNDFLQFLTAREDGKNKTLLVKDAALAEEISKMQTATFLFDHQNVVVGIAE